MYYTIYTVLLLLLLRHEIIILIILLSTYGYKKLNIKYYPSQGMYGYATDPTNFLYLGST